MVCLLLVLTAGVEGWRAYNPTLGRDGASKDSQWTGTYRGKKPGSPPGGKPSGRQANPIAQVNRPMDISAELAGLASKAKLKQTNIAEINWHDQTPAQLWQYWEMLLDRSEFQQIPIVGTLLAERLRKHPDPAVYRGIADLLAQSNIAAENKAILIDLLGEIATPDALEQLINLAKQEIDSPLYILALQALSRIGDNRWDGEFHEELSPALEAAWSNPENNDPAFLGAVGKAIAAVGAPEGVEQLLLTVSGNNKDNDTEETNRIKQEVAFETIPQVRNPEAVEVLGTWLKEEPLGTPSVEVSGNALAEIGSIKATQEIVDWAKDAPAEGTRNLNDWLSKIDDASALASISAVQEDEFQAPEIAAVINSAAVNADAGKVLSSTVLKKDSARVLPRP